MIYLELCRSTGEITLSFQPVRRTYLYPQSAVCGSRVKNCSHHTCTMYIIIVMYWVTGSTVYTIHKLQKHGIEVSKKKKMRCRHRRRLIVRKRWPDFGDRPHQNTRLYIVLYIYIYSRNINSLYLLFRQPAAKTLHFVYHAASVYFPYFPANEKGRSAFEKYTFWSNFYVSFISCKACIMSI